MASVFWGEHLVLAGIPLTNPLGENRQFSLQNMFNLCPFYFRKMWKCAHHMCRPTWSLLYEHISIQSESKSETSSHQKAVSMLISLTVWTNTDIVTSLYGPSNGSWCMGIKGEMSGTVYVTFTWDMYIYIWVVYSLCFFCCLFITVTWWYVWCIEWASGNQEEVQACLVTLWLFIISCYSLLCSWFEDNPHFHKYSMDFHV